ncbi:PIG-L family deacetylase [Ramlibacter sp.]|uniref:PIG-L deacetylase family protein n=1 Tax=Ramlibacter sp. TaxID=1917967 RepID=UPI002D5F8179|nr:PIG-L family deacetylase [Ramlibacter sp.]HYD74806.1 PIG-L family deacetylase [Ramlibacter sp.]
MNQDRAPVLVVAAHPDDEVLGCGGTIARLAGEGRAVHVLILADGESARPQAGIDEAAARASAAQRAGEALGVASVTCLGLPDNRLDTVDLLQVVQAIEAVLGRVQPATVLTHHHGDVNIDHRIAHEAVLAACRPLPGSCVRELLFFEVPSSTEWRPGSPATAFAPTVFVDIGPALAAKMAALEAYAAELRPAPHPRSREAIDALAAWRGASAGVARAEAFMLGRSLR